MLKSQTAQVNERTVPQIRLLTKTLIVVFVAFILANSTIGASQSPLVVAFVASLQPTSGIFAFIGAMAAYFFTGKMALSVVQIASMLMILVIKIVVGELMSKQFKATGCAILSGIIYSGCAVAVVALTTGRGSLAFLAVCQGIFCGSAAYFYKMASTSIIQERKIVLSGTYGAAIAAVFVLCVTALCSVSLSIFNLGRIVALIVVLIAARRYKHVGGSVCGALATLGITLFSTTLGKTALLLAVAGLIAGVFSEFGSVPTAFFFMGANAIGLIIIGVTPETAKILVDVFVASIVFIILPDRLVSLFIGACPISVGGQKMADFAASRLEFAASTISEVKKSVEQVSNALEKKKDENDLTIMVCDNVCANCRNNLYCWEREFDRTFELFQSIKKTIELKRKITQEDLPQGLNNCFKRQNIAEEFNACFEIKNAEYFAKRKIRDMRGLLFEQFNVMEDMLNEISGELSEDKQLDENLSKELTSFLLDFGAITPRACVMYDSFGHISIEAFYKGKLDLTQEEIVSELSDLVNRELDIPQIFKTKETTKLSIIEKPSYQLEIGAIQRSSKSGEPSGDTCEHFNDGHGNEYFVISDGMGTGKMAAVDSMMTANLLIRLLKAGIGYNAAVKLVNSSILVKSSNESFATIDIACVNLYTGKLEILKMGASSTFIRNNGKVINVDSKTLPVGMLENPEYEKRAMILKENDYVIMISDGIIEEFYPFIKSELLRKEEHTASEITEKVIEKYSDSFAGQKNDDISIYTFRLLKNAK